MSSPSRRALLIAALAACSIGGAGSALAQTEEGDECFEECPAAHQVPYVSAIPDTPTFTVFLRRGLPIQCGYPAKPEHNLPELDCHIEGRITVPAKVARYLGLGSRVLADGVAGNRTDHYKDDNDNDQGRAYFLTLPAAVKAKLKAKHVRALGVTLAYTYSVPGKDKLHCGKTTAASCSFDSGRKAWTLGAEDGEIVCWNVMPWWVGVKTTWGAKCPRPITA